MKQSINQSKQKLRQETKWKMDCFYRVRFAEEISDANSAQKHSYERRDCDARCSR